MASLIGPDAEREVLQVVVISYIDLRGKNIIQNNWEEDRITKELYQEILIFWRQTATTSPVYPLIPHSQYPLYPKVTKIGRAPAIDFVFRRGFEEEAYFAFECKLLDHSDRRLVREYVEEGMKRYITGKYSSKMSFGGMVGFMFSNSTKLTVDAINTEISDGGELTIADCLAKGTVKFNGFQDMYTSNHMRSTTGTPFLIYHLFFVF